MRTFTLTLTEPEIRELLVALETRKQDLRKEAFDGPTTDEEFELLRAECGRVIAIRNRIRDL